MTVATEYWSAAESAMTEDSSTTVIPFPGTWEGVGEEETRHFEALGRSSYPRFLRALRNLAESPDIEPDVLHTLLEHQLSGSGDIVGVWHWSSSSLADQGVHRLLETVLEETALQALMLTRAARMHTDEYLGLFADPDPQDVEDGFFEMLEETESREDPEFELPWAGLEEDRD